MRMGEAYEDRKRDADIAQRVMGWRFIRIDYNTPEEGVLVPPDTWGKYNSEWVVDEHSNPRVHASLPQYHAEIGAAMRVVDQMVSQGHIFIIKGDGLRSGDHNPRWTILVDNMQRVDGHDLSDAICRAALAAIGPSV